MAMDIATILRFAAITLVDSRFSCCFCLSYEDGCSFTYIFFTLCEAHFLLMTESSSIRLSTQRGAVAVSIPMVPYASNKGMGEKKSRSCQSKVTFNYGLMIPLSPPLEVLFGTDRSFRCHG